MLIRLFVLLMRGITAVGMSLLCSVIMAFFVIVALFFHHAFY